MREVNLARDSAHTMHECAQTGSACCGQHWRLQFPRRCEKCVLLLRGLRVNGCASCRRLHGRSSHIQFSVRHQTSSCVQARLGAAGLAVGAVGFLVGTALVGALLVGAALVGVCFVGAAFVGAFFVGAALVGAFFVGTALTGVFFVGTFLVGTALTGVFLVGTAFVGAFLVGAALVGAFFVGALCGAALGTQQEVIRKGTSTCTLQVR